MNIDTHELAWAAGFYDGEGCTFIRRHQRISKRDGSTRLCLSPGITIPQALASKDTLGRFQTALDGIGRIVGPVIRRSDKHQDRWEFQATRFEDVQAIIAMLWKYLSPTKREQAARVLTEVIAAKRHLANNPVPWVRRTICKSGHFIPDGGVCRTCDARRGREYRARLKAEAS